jgi:hypothetical protein
MEDESGSSRVLESQNDGKTKESAFKLTSEIKQQTNLQKVFEEKVLDSRVEFSPRASQYRKKGVPRPPRGSCEKEMTEHGGAKQFEGECKLDFDE